MTRSTAPFCDFSMSTWALEASRMLLILHPPRPITRLMTLAGTVTRLDLQPDRACIKKMLYWVQCSIVFAKPHQKESFHCNNFAPTKHLQVLLSGDCMKHDKRDIVRNVPLYLLPGDFFPAFIFALPFARTGAQRWQFGSKAGIALRHVECITETERFLPFIAKSQTLVVEGNSGDKKYINLSILNSYFYSTLTENCLVAWFQS